ncbi:pectinesterase family protein [Allorhizobium taibaishanense]|uniref:Pectinesterase n=1 Tax=Allorhizobium taibaishanense TaxID=887144 RepID=A0A1Q9A3A5_9HYPH|nr:pectinesterase family protein [Allorhizobium taibaishanense]MBB4005879.1 pectinesterase [Allorhizobium taibaishanense]OLP48917.1 hypothetical protein BJF91_17495 [Allorhizobium taibaishanense]
MLRRHILKGCLMSLLLPNLSLRSVFASDADIDAIVDSSSEGQGQIATYPTIAAAIAATPAQRTRPWRIAIREGRYREKLFIDKPDIVLVGAGQEKTVISFDAYAGGTAPDGSHWGTFGSGTIIVRAPGFAAKDLTIANTFDFLAHDGRDPHAVNRVGASQAVALMLDRGADRSLFDTVAINGFQDTLFTDQGRSLFRRCQISGNVDFIFGAGTALFVDCDIVSRKRADPAILPAGFVTAPSTALAHPYGLVFHHCRLLKEDASIPPASHYLGRPWHPTRDFADGRYADPDAVGQAVFLTCEMEDHIATNGWTEMTGLAKDGTRRSFLPFEHARFLECESHGPGAAVNPDRPQLTTQQAALFAPEKVLGDWHAALLQQQ